MTQICRDLGIKCLYVQPSGESARALAIDLGLQEEGLAEEEGGLAEEEEGSAEEDGGNTDNLLNLLSAIGKTDVKPSGGPSKEHQKTLGTTSCSTRSKGTAFQWSKSLNADKPIL